ncbi:hypothetical protein BGX27_009899 [Mortierella sp. AM989]|nr:hypothetical protein BGX27_009899 [Mortierella sp. AM989]
MAAFFRSTNSPPPNYFSHFSSIDGLPYVHQYNHNPRLSQQQQQQQQPQQPQQQIQPNPSEDTFAMTTEPNSYLAFFDTPSYPSLYPQQQSSPYQIHESIDPAPSSPRRSMTPIGGAASAMKNFLRRRRGTLSGTPTSNIVADINTNVRHSSGDIGLSPNKSVSNSYELPSPQPSMSAQSFVFVGGYGVEPGTTMVVTEADDLPESYPSSPQHSPYQTPVSKSPIYPTAASTAMVTTAAAAVAVAPQQTFSQVMATHLSSQERSPSQASSIYTKNHSRHVSMNAVSFSSTSSASSFSSSPPSSLCSNVSQSNAAPATPASKRRSQGRRSLPSQSSNAATQKGQISGAHIYTTEKGIVFQNNSINNDNNSTALLKIPSDIGTKHEQDLDWADRKIISKELSLVFNVAGLLDNSFKIQSTIDHDTKRQTQEASQRQQQLEQDYEEAEEVPQPQPQSQQQKLDAQKRQLYENSILFLEGMHNIPEYTSSRDITSFDKSNPNNSSQTQRRRQSESVLQNKFDEQTSATDTRDTAAALEDLEKEIVTLSKEIIIPTVDQVLYETEEEPKESQVTQQQQQQQQLLLPSGVDILLVSDSSSPTQFYDTEQTRYALRSFLIGGNREFDEMVEYGFPSEIFSDSSATTGESEAIKTHTATASDPLTEMNCRYRTLRITLTPWHARADEAKLYGSESADSGKQTQLKTMVNKFFSRSPAVTAAPSPAAALMSSPPPSQRARMMCGSRRPSEQSVTTVRSNRSSAEQSAYRPTPAELARSTPNSRPESFSAQPATRLSYPGEEKEGGLLHASSSSENRSSSEASSRVYSCGDGLKQENKSRVPNRHMDSSTQSPLSLHPVSSSRPTSRMPVAEGIISSRPRLSPPSTRTPSPMLSIGDSYGSQPPRKGSLTALSVPIKDSQDSTQTCSDRGVGDGAFVAPYRRKCSSSAIFGAQSGSNLREVPLADSNRGIPPVAAPRYLLSEGRSFSAGSVTKSSDGGSDINSSSPSESPTPTAHQLYATQQQEPKRSARYPYQQHTLYQEQIQQQQQQQQQQQKLPMPNSIRAPGSSQQPHPLSAVSHSVPLDVTENIYDCYNAAFQDKFSGQASQQQRVEQEPHENKSSTRQSKKLFQFSSRDKKRDNVKAKAAEQTPVVPPRINVKSWRRRGQQQYRQDDSDAPSEAAIIAAAAAAATNDEQFLCGKYEYQDTNRHEQNPEAYFETSIDNQSYGGYAYGEQGGMGGNYYSHQSRTGAVNSEGCWRPVQCQQTDAMKTFAFP